MVNILLKRSTDETPWEDLGELNCYTWIYEKYAQNSDLPGIHGFGVIEDVNVNGTDVCVISMEGEEFNLANGIACDCSDPENFDFEDNGRFSIGFPDWNFSDLLWKFISYWKSFKRRMR